MGEGVLSSLFRDCLVLGGTSQVFNGFLRGFSALHCILHFCGFPKIRFSCKRVPTIYKAGQCSGKHPLVTERFRPGHQAE